MERETSILTERVWCEVATISLVQCLWFTYENVPIAHSQAEMDCFVYQKFTEGEVIDYLYGTLVYQFPVNELIALVVHLEAAMAVPREQLHTTATTLP